MMNSNWYKLNFVQGTLYLALSDSSWFEENKNEFNSNLYLVKISRLNDDKNTLMFNYITYNIVFKEALLAYIMIKPDFTKTLVFQEWGDHVSIIDEDMIKYLNINSWNDMHSYNEHFKLNKKNTGSDMDLMWLDNAKKCSFYMDYKRMAHLLDLSVNKSSMHFILNLLNPTLNSNDIAPLNIKNIEGDVLFLISDMQKFIHNIKDKNIIINQGVQSRRGMINKMSSFLCSFDFDFRNCLYKQHVGNRFNGSKCLTKDKFGFKNIHINLGNVRYYSSRTEATTINKRNKKVIAVNVENNIDLIYKNQDIYKELGKYISRSPTNNDTQSKIENYLLNTSYIIGKEEKDSLINYNLISSKLKQLLLDKSLELNRIFDKLREENVSLNPRGRSASKNKGVYYLNLMVKHLNNEMLISIMYGRLLRIITYYDMHNTTTQNYLLEILHDITNNLIREFCYKNYLNTKEDKETFTMWKDRYKDTIAIFDDLTLKTNIGGLVLEWLTETELLQVKTIILSKKEKVNIVVPSENTLLCVGNNKTVMNLPRKIPMIVKPKPYLRDAINSNIVEKLGGYLLNDEKYTESLMIRKWNLKQQSVILDMNIVYRTANNINSVGFKINTNVLEFLQEYGYKYGLIEYINTQNELLSKKKVTQAEYKQLQSYLSSLVLQENILGLASAFSGIHEFFIPIRMDFRGRVYCTSEFLNYQSTELSKSLILFSKSEKMYKNDETAIKYFKAYGANCYGNKLDKKSWNDRVLWVDNNIENIINFKNGKLISTAENKLLFIAFCFEFNRWIVCLNNDLSYFETNLPIQLDATCNGYQHLSLLSNDAQLANELNLTKSDWNDVPKDFYTYMSSNVVTYFKDKLKHNNLTKADKESYTRLSDMKIQRTVIKTTLMTIPYGVGNLKMINYIQEHFEPVNPKSAELNQDTWFRYKENHDILLKNRDFSELGKSLRRILDSKFNKLNQLVNYLNNLAKICNKLNLVIPWTSSTGISVKQSYLATDEIRLLPFTYSKKSVNVRLPSMTGKFDVRKQKRSFMANVVHTLDAMSLAMLVDLYFNDYESETKNIYSVHDCFAVTANNVDNLMSLLKLVYRKIYYEDKFILNLDKEVKHNIIAIYGEQSLDLDTLEVRVPDITMKFPNVKDVVGDDTEPKFLSSSYLIN